MPYPPSISSAGLSGPSPFAPASSRPAGSGESGATGNSFASALRDQLEKVSEMQSDADQKLQNVLTGDSQNVTEVLVAARKADVAFSLLMELRNKLVDAYQELQNLRV